MKKFVLTCSCIISTWFVHTSAANSSTADSTCFATADFNGDSVVNIMDVIPLLEVIRDSTSTLPLWVFDINADCTIDAADVEFFWFFAFVNPFTTYFPVQTCCNPTVNVDCCFVIPGNVDGDPNERFNIVDITYLANYLFAGGQAPNCRKEANIDGDPQQVINLLDLTKAASWLFMGGPAPQNCYGSAHWPN